MAGFFVFERTWKIFLACFFVTSVWSAPSFYPQQQYQEVPVYHLSADEIEAHLTFMESTAIHNLTAARLRKYDQGHEHGNLHKRGAESSRTCYKRDTFHDTDHGRVPDLLYHWVKASCEVPHKKSTFIVTCEERRILPDGRQIAKGQYDYVSRCEPDEYCYDIDAEENDIGVYNEKGIPDIGCARREKTKKLQAVAIETSRYTPVKGCSEEVNPLDQKFAKNPNIPQRSQPAHRKFLLTSESVCPGDVQCKAKELYIEENNEGSTRIISQGTDTQAIHAEVEYEHYQDPRFYLYCFMGGISLVVYWQLLYFTVNEMAVWRVYMPPNELGPNNATDALTAAGLEDKTIDYTATVHPGAVAH